jgi:hypothetical protein
MELSDTEETYISIYRLQSSYQLWSLVDLTIYLWQRWSVQSRMQPSLPWNHPGNQSLQVLQLFFLFLYEDIFTAIKLISQACTRTTLKNIQKKKIFSFQDNQVRKPARVNNEVVMGYSKNQIPGTSNYIANNYLQWHIVRCNAYSWLVHYC